MSINSRLFTYEVAYIGKKINYLPITDGTCTRKAGFIRMLGSITMMGSALCSKGVCYE